MAWPKRPPYRPSSPKSPSPLDQPKPKRKSPELTMQMREIIPFLEKALPPETGIDWTAINPMPSASPNVRGMMYAAGVRNGWGDLLLQAPHRCHDEIELKRPRRGGTQSDDQKAHQARLEAQGGRYAVVRGVVALSLLLESWDYPVRYIARPFGLNGVRLSHVSRAKPSRSAIDTAFPAG